jgi:histidinol-phosphate/aromatic aminotransferase/cobyric acid decarboxylase-like protein
MDFRTFMKQRAELLQQYPDALDLTETNVVTALGSVRPQPSEEALARQAYRCHLAEFWLDALNLPRALKPQALVSQGVRHSLEQLFALFARQGAQAILPSDVYPVYLDIANSQGLTYSTYPAAKSIVEAFSAQLGDVLLVTNPVKPWGHWLDDAEVDAIRAWLSQNPARRVVVDAVYTWNDQLDSTTQTLFATGQAYVLHSLSKGWLYPLAMGVALVPAQDVDLCTPIFRALSLSQDSLRIAQSMLTEHPDFPNALSLILADIEDVLFQELAARGVAQVRKSPIQGLLHVWGRQRYHFVVDENWQVLLKDHGVLALPASVFGEADDHVSVVTSLDLARLHQDG